MSGAPNEAAEANVPAPSEAAVPQTSTENASQVPAETEKTEDAAASAETPTRRDSEEWPEGTPEWAKKEISKLRTRERKARARAEAAEAQGNRFRSEYEQVARQQPREPDRSALKEPRVDEFSRYEDYERANASYIADLAKERAKQELRTETEARERRAKEQAEAERMRDAGRKFREEIDKASSRYEDIHEAVDALFNGEIPANNAMAEYVIEVADDKAALAHHLFSHPDVAERIARLSPIATARELARLEASLKKPEARTDTSAPPPAPRVKGTGSGSKDPEKMSIDEMRAATKSQRRVDY